MTADERRAMRELLRASLAHAVLPGAQPDPPGAYVRDDDPPPDLLARFTAELTTLGGAVHLASAGNAATVAAIVADIAARESSKRVLMWDDRWIPVDGLAQALEGLGFQIERQESADMPSAERRTMLADASVGITGVEACLAETGSVALVSGAGRGRLASLLPAIHVAIARRADFLRSFPDLLASRPELVSAGSNLVCITGPSRTADIEHTLSRGVHGPCEIHVIVID